MFREQSYLTPEQKEIIMKYIKDRRDPFMMTLYVSAVMSVLLAPLARWDFRRLCLSPLTYHGRSRAYGIILTLWAICFLVAVVYFIQGIGKTFWKNSDYDCLKHDAYTIDFLECTGKLPDSGKYPYFVTDSIGNAYQCTKFLEWRNIQNGEQFLAVTLKNGQKFALLHHINLDP